MKRTQEKSVPQLRDALSRLSLAMLELSKAAGCDPLWNEGGDGFEAFQRALSLLNARSGDVALLRPAIEACLDVMAGIAATAGDVPDWNKDGDAYEATHFAREVLSSQGMKVLVELSCSSRDLDDPGQYGLITLTQDFASKLLSLHTKARAFLQGLAADGLVSDYIAPSFGISAYAFVAYRYTDPLAALLPDGERIVVLPEGTVLEVGEDIEERVECFRVCIRETSVQLSGTSKHGDYKLTAEDIPLDMLRVAAAT